jgi:hypothetical protein
MAAGPIVIHSLEQARLAASVAAELGVPLMLASAPGAGGYAGPAWFGEIIAAARAEYPAAVIGAILDCGDTAGPALATLRWAKTARPTSFSLCFTGDDRAARSLGEMAAALGVGFLRSVPASLDLRWQRDPQAASRDWLTSVAADP